MKKRIFSGIQPTGNIHVGNYLGAVRSWVQFQADYDNIFCIVDLHAITVPQDPKKLRSNIRELAGLLIACGIDPKESALFVQSDIAEHSELAWILNCVAPMGWMSRMTQFKEKSGKQKEKVSIGLFSYPALMAADILLYETDLVPVGEDQTQHLEFTRDLAQRFNSLYGETFKLPDIITPKVGSRVMALDDPTKKMSKSDDKEGHAIFLLDNPDLIRKKIARATTDSEKTIVFDEKRPGIYNLLCLFEVFSSKKRSDIEKQFEGKGYGDFKKELSDVIIEALSPIQSRYTELTKDPAYLDNLLEAGADRIRPKAEATIQSIKNQMGLG